MFASSGGWADEPGAVGEHDRLHAVAEPELLEDVPHVGAHGGIRDEEPRRDLAVRISLADQREDLALRRCEPVEFDAPVPAPADEDG